MTPEFWQGKRVLLTGHTGFKGSWMSLWLQSLGAELHGFALSPLSSPSLFETAGLMHGMCSEIGDIRDYDHVLRVVQDFQPEIVIHMAAQPLVRYSYRHPIETYATNVMGTVHLLEATRQVGSAKVIVNITTDKCYENREWVWGYREDEPMGGHDPYSSSKACAELVSSAYRRSFLQEAGISLATVRAGNVIGGGDWAEDRLVPDMLRAFEKGLPVVIRNPLSTRPWQHVLEPLSGYLDLAERLWHEPLAFAEGWNFGPKDEDAKPVEWIVSKLCDKWGSGASWRLDDAAQPHEAGFLKLDISKARHLLGWGPRWSLEQALEKIVSWHKAWLAGEDMRQLCLQQIHEYQKTPIKY
ncbi:CDP-glucose 4,6-dehydratase [Aquitalea sp. ASV15]|uniref:CDP-glucose 4,6-dehydratase n=1 Tax=Aquitalea sp. ASV15 TaxID=2795104 RepID=UPI0018ECB4D5|nr:CDP-glucose 4,6-dehydratase [Aquitalea sp. ASV15]